MRARIFQPPKTAMQSGWARTHEWVLEFITSHGRHADPLMGWIGGGDTQTQVRLYFDTRDEAIAYAERAGIALRRRTAAGAPDQAEGLRRQLQLRPDRKLDALTVRPDGRLYRSHRRGAGSDFWPTTTSARWSRSAASPRASRTPITRCAPRSGDFILTLV